MNINHLIINKKLFFWLFVSSIMVVIMIILGGATRLTHSGLSIVEWRPITGILPPLNETSWIEELNKYKLFPEFKKINPIITLAEFKFIYLLEYIHRLAARITGLVFILPFLYFLYKKQLTSYNIKIFFLISFVGLIQGYIGWYMVKSGLNTRPYISHFRLTFHLLSAFFILGLIFWQALNFIRYEDSLPISKNLALKIKYISLINFIFLLLQITLGGLTAGLKAGLIYNNFPFMGEKIIALEVFQGNISLLHFLSNPAAVQFFHRITAFIVFFITLFSKFYISKHFTYNMLNKTYNLFIYLVASQILLGILTLTNMVPITLGLVHQFCSVILYCYILFIIHLIIKYQQN